MKATFRALALTLPLLGLLPGCRAKETPASPAAAAPGMPSHGGAMAKKESKVVVPESQKGKWKAIKIAVTDLATGKETTHVAPLGGDYLIPGTGLTLRVETVLPDFGMGEGVITSKSDKMENPAAQVRVLEGGKEMFKGWMFKLYPEAHPFENAKYGIKLLDFVPAK